MIETCLRAALRAGEIVSSLREPRLQCNHTFSIVSRLSLHSVTYSICTGKLFKTPREETCSPQSQTTECYKRTIYKCTLYTAHRSRPRKALGPALRGRGLPGKPARRETNPRGTGKDPARRKGLPVRRAAAQLACKTQAEAFLSRHKFTTVGPRPAHAPRTRGWRPHSDGRT